MSANANAVVYPTQYEDGRIYLQVFGLYGLGASLLGIFNPPLFFTVVGPMLQLIEKYTSLTPSHPPQTPNEYAANTFAFAFSLGIGWIYSAYSGPFWERGGRVLVEGGIWTRIMYISGAYAFCFLTPYGSTLLCLVATNDVISVLLTKWAIGASWMDLVWGQTRAVSVSAKSR